jgi:hypothetical protein
MEEIDSTLLMIDKIKFTEWSRASLEKLTVGQQLKRYVAFHGNRRVISRARHWTLS